MKKRKLVALIVFLVCLNLLGCKNDDVNKNSAKVSKETLNNAENDEPVKIETHDLENSKPLEKNEHGIIETNPDDGFGSVFNK